MKFPVEAGAVYLRAVETTAANEEFTDVTALDSPSRASTSGWDPYEVWRTRVKDEAESVERGSRTA
jgi:hypothetical protein